jgi:hypothetical protein
VIPESEDPIIPNATRYHGERRLAVKNVSDVAPFDVKTEMTIKAAK